ncbi:hypothetical protein Poli38472_003440 [Pythium oligandrum]|uniref:Transmembrane protein n=1 Tax=Pythium oligandrum TaxID=41045 RepID=A0A8K1C726_PYTOL|nr:hypothetical protein Poli38472_003440 [Pythium oligandrum]|eukprot:TMW57515.1 hypothetical protein Poli38472_003440 [Pythium oligandrum]
MISSAPTPNPDAVAVATTLSVRVKRVRLLVCAFVTVVLISGAVIFFRGGVTLLEFEAPQDDGSEAATNTLVDTYNAYTANFAAALGRPIAVVVGLVVQVFLLRFATRFMLQVRQRWRLMVALLSIAAFLEYLVLNGLNAVNVQSRHLDFKPVISPSDFSVSGETAVIFVDNVSSTSATFPETSPKNPIANTVLRQAILPHVMKIEPGSRKCDVVAFSIPREDVISYGFPSRTWQRAMLPEALDPQVLRVEIGANTSNSSVDLPMSASRAASMFANGLLMSRTVFPWFGKYWTSIKLRKPTLAQGESRTVDLATSVGLLPDEQAISDKKKKANEHVVAMEFAHVDISPTVTFDAITFQVELSPEYMPSDFEFPNGSMYNQFEPLNSCGPFPGICVFGKPQYGNDPLVADVPSQINVLAACDNGEPAGGGVAYRYTNDSSRELAVQVDDCANVSASSLFVVSAGKYLVADRLEENASNQSYPDISLDRGAVLNLRKVYTFTIGRLSWQSEELATHFHASCDIDGGSECLGLRYTLEDGRVLILGSDNLPLNRLATLATNSGDQSGFLSLVKIVEPPTQVEKADDFRSLTVNKPSDVLLLHNVDKISWTQSSDVHEVRHCITWIEDRIHNVLNNHLYIEHPLQASYTAAMFFLFQDATVKDVITLSDGSTSLKFDKNVQKMALRLVIPLQSARLTLIGCAMLFLGALTVVVYTTWMRQRNDPLDQISEAQVVAQVMVDESKYSPFMLHRRLVRHQNHRQLNREAVSGYAIDEIALQHQHVSSERVRFYRGYCERLSTPTASTVSMSENPWILSQHHSLPSSSLANEDTARKV